MHTLHYIAVTAEDKQDAFGKVSSQLEPTEFGRIVGWSDWHVVGGGRWNTEPANQYNDSSNNIISYEEDRDDFDKAIESVRKWRIHEMNKNIKDIDFDKITSDMVDYISNGGELQSERKFDLHRYSLKLSLDALSGYWTPDSGFYNIDWGSADFSTMQESIDNGNKNWYLVPVDFHF